MRARTLSHEAVRTLGIELNGGRVHGWMERVGKLLDTPPTTVRAWSTPATSRASRPIPGAAANLLVFYLLAQRWGLPPDDLAREVDAEIARIDAGTGGGVAPAA
jgi:hypothetical protein